MLSNAFCRVDLSSGSGRRDQDQKRTATVEDHADSANWIGIFNWTPLRVSDARTVDINASRLTTRRLKTRVPGEIISTSAQNVVPDVAVMSTPRWFARSPIAISRTIESLRSGSLN
jgi:hypothetical protein